MAKRKSINWPGFKHENPIPNASMIGNILMSSIMSGRDPDTHTMPPDAEAQVANIFKQIRLVRRSRRRHGRRHHQDQFLGQGSGGRPQDAERPVDEMFPDAASRPARHTLALRRQHAQPRDLRFHGGDRRLARHGTGHSSGARIA